MVGVSVDGILLV
jgi:hypothetical protein